MTRRLCDPHIARDNGIEDFVLEKRDQLGRDIQCQVVAGIVHGAQKTLDDQTGIEMRLYLPHRIHQRRQTLQGIVFGLDGYQDPVRRDLLTKEQFEALMSSVEPQVVDLTMSIVKKVFGEEVSVNPEVVLKVTQNALRTVRQRREINIRANPEDVAALQENRRELLDVLLENGAITEEQYAELSGDPVEPSDRSADKSSTSPGRTSALRHPSKNAAPAPK